MVSAKNVFQLVSVTGLCFSQNVLSHTSLTLHTWDISALDSVEPRSECSSADFQAECRGMNTLLWSSQLSGMYVMDRETAAIT